MKIHLNEHEIEVADGTGLFGLRDREKPDADVVIYNGATGADDVVLK